MAPPYRVTRLLAYCLQVVVHEPWYGHPRLHLTVAARRPLIRAVLVRLRTLP